MIFVYVFWKYLPMTELMAAFKNNATAPGNTAAQDWYGLTYFNEIFFGGAAGTTRMIEFWRAFRNTFTIAFYNLLFGFPVPIIIALFFNEVRSNIARSIMQVCVYLPKFMSTVVVTTLVITLFRAGDIDGANEMGVVSKLLVLIAGENSPLASAATSSGLIYSARYYRALFVITELWEHAGYDSIVFFAAVIAVSPTSYEAAQIDGAGKMQQMRYVVIPSILSTVVIMLIMKIGSLLSVGYEKVYLLCPSSNFNNYQVANVVSTLNMLNADFNNGYGVAAEMTNNLIGMILVIGANTVARKASDVSLY
jgi:putative aldouronate transport system permease protein